jgi:hypothetical protein
VIAVPALSLALVTGTALLPAAADSGQVRKVPLYPESVVNGVNQDPGFCADGAAPAAQSNGFIVAQRAGTTLTVNLHLKGASPNATYQVNQSCRIGNIATLATSPNGVGNVEFSYTVPADESQFVFDACLMPCGTRSNETYYASALMMLP